ncbi:MAG: inositol monophosphatase [Gammaproteobacteria bacterium]|nr:inositol monophosphatase [Gammaproteobacteria bacterium]
MHPFINTAIKAARLAGDIIMRGYERLDTIKVSNKDPHDLVTNIDLAAERAIIETIESAYPDHGFLGEETGVTNSNNPQLEYQWIIDPLDGTTNFVHGFGHFAVSIALKYKNKIEHGVIYDPLRNDLFTASRGRGATKNNQRIRVGNKTELQEALIGTGFPFRSPRYLDAYYEALKRLSTQCLGMRRAGAAALDLAYVASGQLDGFWETGLKPWDIAAGVLLIKEAGGLVSDLQGNEKYFENGSLVCGNPKIFKALLTLLKPFFEKQI